MALNLRQNLILAFIAFFICLLPITAIAAEVINSFDSRIELAKDGTLVVTETILVQAEGKNIRRGIYRDFPLLFEDENGRERKVGFELLSTKRDGKADGNRVESNGKQVRIYIGKKDFFLPLGQYVYEIKYKTDRQVRFFDTHDELFWNVTGNFWNFPILKSSATFILPNDVQVLKTAGFTGVFGSTEKAVSISSNANRVEAVATAKFAAGEGMSIAIKMPLGSIAAPSEAQQSAWFWQDNMNIFISIGALLIVVGYYFVNWWLVGRDPAPGVVVPRWDAPDGLSPALVNYITNKGLAGKGFDAISSAILNLAVKGLVTIDKHVDDLIITAVAGAVAQKLPVGESSILSRIKDSHNQQLKVSKTNSLTIQDLQLKFASAMETEHRNKYYEENLTTSIFGVVLSVLVLGIMLYVGSYSDDVLGFLFGAAFITVIFSIIAISIIKRITTQGHMFEKIISLAGTGFMTFVFLSGLFSSLSEFLVNVHLGQDAWLLITVVGIIVLNVLFYFLLGAPTSLGRKKMDDIEGLKTYLTLAEKDRMNMREAPDFSEKHYEELLPYAVALGVEKPWSQSFQTWLAAAVAAGAVAASSYQPNWYSGRSFSGDTLSDTMGDFTNSMQSGFSSAMPVPKSSSSGFSGGGGGSSGGGGGGGGGGGW